MRGKVAFHSHQKPMSGCKRNRRRIGGEITDFLFYIFIWKENKHSFGCFACIQPILPFTVRIADKNSGRRADARRPQVVLRSNYLVRFAFCPVEDQLALHECFAFTITYLLYTVCLSVFACETSVPLRSNV